MNSIRTSSIISLIVAAMLSACSGAQNEPGKANPNIKYKATGGSQDAIDAQHEAYGAKGKDDTLDEQTDTDTDKGEGLGETKDDVTVADDGDVIDDKVIPTKDGGKDGDDDVKGGKGGKGDDTPAQNPTDDEEDEPEVVVELPKAKCIYNDPNQPNFIVPKDAFGPNLPPMAIPRTAIDGALQADNETFIGAFTVFLYPGNIWRLDWDGRAGRVPHDYTMVVIDAVDDGCTAYLKFVKQEPRTLNGCFDLATKVRMADGKDQIIAMITKGDMIYNPMTRAPAKVLEVVKGPEADKAMYEIAFAGHKVLVTETHPMPVKGSLKQAKAVTTDDYMYDEKGIVHRVTGVKVMPVNAKQVVVNLRLESGKNGDADHMILAEGMMTGDLHLQQRLVGQQTAAK